MAEDGLTIALSPVQMAAILTNDTITTQATLSNRLWGGAKVLGGVLELIGAGALCLAPEPTMASKAGCVVVGVHGSDTTSTGLTQIWTGRVQTTLTQKTATALAKIMGASDKTAQDIGLTVDIAVPIGGLTAGMIRIASIQGGRISLAAHEAMAGSRVGGHTISRHIGISEAELRARLAAQARIPAASTFSTLSIAEQVISKALTQHSARIITWSQTARSGSRLALASNAGKIVGQGVIRSSGKLVNMNKIRIVLKYETYNNKPYYILTAFPIP